MSVTTFTAEFTMQSRQIRNEIFSSLLQSKSLVIVDLYSDEQTGVIVATLNSSTITDDLGVLIDELADVVGIENVTFVTNSWMQLALV